MNKVDKFFLKKKLKIFIEKNIDKNQDICLHCDLIKLNSLLKFKNETELYKFIIGILNKKNRTLIIPAFSFSWGREKKKKIYNIKKSKSKLGFLSEYMRKKNLGHRTFDPMFSFFILGKNKEYLDFKNNSFGKGSIFEKMHHNNCKIILFDTLYFEPTFIHYIEQYCHENFTKLNYRYLKRFIGYIKIKNQKKKFITTVFSRVLKAKYVYNDKKIFTDLIKEKKLKKIQYKNIRVLSFDSKDLFKIGFNGLKKDKLYFCKNA